jgi:5-(carboxyamino)imidazole ribonucleotide synthase
LLGESEGPVMLTGLSAAYKNPHVRVHIYGKPESKKHRKMGHFTVAGKTAEDALEQARQLKEVLHVIGDPSV